MARLNVINRINTSKSQGKPASSNRDRTQEFANNLVNTTPSRDISYNFPDMSAGLGRGPSQTPIPIGSVSTRNSEEDEIMAAYEEYAKKLEGMSASQKAEALARYAETAGLLNKNYDRNANYAYINYKQGQKELPRELSSAGITGGATESANIKLQNAYGANLANNEYSRNNDLASAKNNYNSALNGIDTDLNSQLANAYADYSQRSFEYKQQKKEKAEEKERLKTIAAKNNDTQSKMAARQKQGYDVTTWTDEDGLVHYRIVGNSKEEAKKKQDEIDKKNNATQAMMAKRVREGYDVYTWTDGSGLFHYRITSKKKLNSSGGSGGSSRSVGSSGSSSGYASSVPPAKSTKSKSTSKTKSKPDINYSQAMLYYNQNLVKILNDPYSVVKDLDNKVKSGKMNEITSDYIMTKFPRRKTKGKRKKKG